MIGFFLFGNTPKKVKQLIRNIKIIKEELNKKNKIKNFLFIKN